MVDEWPWNEPRMSQAEKDRNRGYDGARRTLNQVLNDHGMEKAQIVANQFKIRRDGSNFSVGVANAAEDWLDDMVDTPPEVDWDERWRRSN